MDGKSKLSPDQSFHRLTVEERHVILAAASETDLETLKRTLLTEPLSPKLADHWIENAVGYFQLPLGIATHLKVDGRELLVPMAVEETSIIAAVSSTAKWIDKMGGTVQTRMEGSYIIGQVQFPRLENSRQFSDVLLRQKSKWIEQANLFVPGLVRRGGGIKDLEVRIFPRADGRGEMGVVHFYCDPCDAMGANLINQVCEAMKADLETATGERGGLCILSNLVDSKLAVAEVVIPGVDGELGVGIEEASIFAESDPYRATTHNKGVLNGIDPILIATGNDWRAVEAGAHAYAALSGKYQPVTKWRYDADAGILRGVFRAPLAVGTAGGVTTSHPVAKWALKILRVQKSEDLSRICAAVGLVQNLGALKALSTVGVVKGHMQLHATNLALLAGATHDEVAEVKARLSEILAVEKNINVTRAREVLDLIRENKDR
jgi:hydroxymethylglutaryl-CoA reductase